MKELEQRLTSLKVATTEAKAKRKAAEDECKKLEKDMNEFKNNKDGKLKELKVSNRTFHRVMLRNYPLGGHRQAKNRVYNNDSGSQGASERNPDSRFGTWQASC